MRRERTGLRKMCNVCFTADLYLQNWQQVCALCWAWMPPYLHPETFSNKTPVNHPPQGFYISPSLHHTFCFRSFEWRFLFAGLIKAVGAGLMFSFHQRRFHLISPFRDERLVCVRLYQELIFVATLSTTCCEQTPLLHINFLRFLYKINVCCGFSLFHRL